jgi:outer membrane protein assembly factor BamE (lipoprotein component of BamABCDE complex)
MTLPLVLLLIVLTGWSSTDTDPIKDLPADWPPLGTTRAEVRQRLGSPSSQSVTVFSGAERETWSYHFEQADSDPFLLKSAFGFPPALNDDGGKDQGKGLVIIFDAGGKVIERSMRP